MNDESWYTVTGQLNFIGFDNLVGGSGRDAFSIAGTRSVDLFGMAGADVFQFESLAILTGVIDGGTGADRLDFAGTSGPHEVTLAGPGEADGVSGTDSTVKEGFYNIDLIVGGTGNDTFRGMAAEAVWQLDSIESYSAATTNVLFEGFENLAGDIGPDRFMIVGLRAGNLLGGSGFDMFQFSDGAVLTGGIDGGADTDTIDYSGYSTGVVVDLATGAASHVSAGIIGIENATGGAGMIS